MSTQKLKEELGMKSTLFRTTSALLLLAVCFVPVYAHHGTQFLTTSMEANAAEVKIAELAQSKAQDQQVKEFASMIVKDHTMALDKMQMLMDDRVNAKVAKTKMDWHSMKLNSMHQKTFDRLSKLSGNDFDREFMITMVTEHQTAIRDFETHARSHGNTATTDNTGRQKPSPDNVKVDYARDTDTIAFANEMLPTLKNHLEMAQNIQKDMKGTTPTSKTPATKKY
jgi:putative membrane protein